MQSTRLSDDEFRRRHREHLASHWWRANFRPKALAFHGFRCAVCGYGYRDKGYSPWQLHLDHRRYWKDGRLIFGRESFSDVRAVCPDHDGKGVRSDWSIRQWRSAQRWLWAFGLLERLALACLRQVASLVLRLMRYFLRR